MKFGRDSHQLLEGGHKDPATQGPMWKAAQEPILATCGGMQQAHSIAFARKGLEPPSLAPGTCDSLNHAV